MSKKSSILVPILITLLVAPIYASDLDGMNMNGLLISGSTWDSTHNNTTIVIDVEITNESSVPKEDVRIYVTGVMASPWGLLNYKKPGKWEKTSQFTGDILEAKVNGPKAALPSDQERNVAPWSSLDASYPYITVGYLNSGETKSATISVRFQVKGGSGYHNHPYTFWLCLADGGQKVPQKNRPPTAYDAEVTTAVDTPVDVTLYATDPDGDDLFYGMVTYSNMHGDLEFTPPNLVTYTPDPGFIGTDIFGFWVEDKKTSSNLATVTITVGDTPDTLRPRVVITPEGGTPEVVFINKDSTLFNGEPDTNYGTLQYCGASNADYWYNYSRGILEFDISALPETVTSATLQIHGLPRGLLTPGEVVRGDVSIHKVTSPWEEMAVTWNTMPSFNTTSMDIVIPDVERWYEWDITSLYNEWKSGVSENYGILLINQMEGTPRTGIGLKSSDWEN